MWTEGVFKAPSTTQYELSTGVVCCLEEMAAEGTLSLTSPFGEKLLLENRGRWNILGTIKGGAAEGCFSEKLSRRASNAGPGS